MERNHAAATRRLGERCRPRGRRRFRTRRGGRWFDAGASPGGLASLTASRSGVMTYIDGFVCPYQPARKRRIAPWLPGRCRCTRSTGPRCSTAGRPAAAARPDQCRSDTWSPRTRGDVHPVRVDISRPNELLQPVCDDRCGAPEPVAEAVVSRDEQHGSTRGVRWNAERVPLALNDEGRCGDDVELGEAARPWLGPLALGRLQRKGEAQHTDRARRASRSARDSRSGGAASDNERPSAEPASAQLVDHRHPDHVELPRRRR